MKIENILATKGTQVHTILPDRTIKEAVSLLSRHNIGALVVIDDMGRPIGILSERDIVHAAARADTILAQKVSSVMTEHIITGTPHDDIRSVERTMTDKHIRHIPVMDQGQLIGIVSIGDVVKAQLEQYAGEVDNLQTQITQG